MFKLNVKSDLIQKSAHASYRLAMRICDSDVEGYITEDAMENLAEAWYESKENFIDLFGGKTTIEETIELPLESHRVETLIREFFEKLIRGEFTYKREFYQLKFVKPFDIKRGVMNKFYRTLIHYSNIDSVNENILTENMVQLHDFVELCDSLGLNPSRYNGMKISKFFILLLKEIMKTVDTERTDEMKKLETMEIDIISQDFSQLINTLKTAKRKQTVVLSVALEDFISMSYGNGWESCHRLGGLYGQGCIAYALSKNVVLAYVKNEINKYQKNWRQVIYCDAETGFAIGSRQYPTVNENASKLARNMWQKTFNGKNYNQLTTEGFVFSKKSSGMSEWIETHNEFAYIDIHQLGYGDSRIDGNVWMTWHKEHGKNTLVACEHEILCLTCGEWHSDRSDNSVSCENCYSGDKCYCEYCGYYHHEDDVQYVDCENGYVCDDCLGDNYTYCEHCNDYYRDEDTVWIESEGRSVCQSCCDYHYDYCEECNEYVSNDEAISVNGGDMCVCEYCIDNGKFGYCENCEEYFTIENLTEVDGEHYCEGCLDYHCVQCDDCLEYFKREDVFEHNEQNLCDDCYNEAIENDDEDELC